MAVVVAREQIGGPIRMTLSRNAFSNTHRLTAAQSPQAVSPPIITTTTLLLPPAPLLSLSFPGRSTTASTEPLHNCGARPREVDKQRCRQQRTNFNEAGKQAPPHHTRASRTFAPLPRERIAHVVALDFHCSLSLAPSPATVRTDQQHHDHRQTHPRADSDVAETTSAAELAIHAARAQARTRTRTRGRKVRERFEERLNQNGSLP